MLDPLTKFDINDMRIALESMANSSKQVKRLTLVLVALTVVLVVLTITNVVLIISLI